jgi:protein SCO1
MVDMRKRKSKNKIIIIVLTICSIIYFALNYFRANETATTKQITSSETPDIGGNFTLIDTNGTSFNSESLRDKPTMIYFGFTYCPDVCVVSLQKINKVLEILDESKIDVNPVFITLDPKRDTPEVLENYFANLSPKFITLTGSKDQIKEVADLFKVYYSVRGDENSNDYLLDHSTFIYLFGKGGKYMTHFSIDTKVEEIVEYIRANFK